MCKKWDWAFDTYIFDEPVDYDDDDIVELTNPISDDTPMGGENEGYYNVYKILKHKFQQGWKFLVWWEGFPITASTFEPISSFILANGSINSVFKAYCVDNGLTHILQKVLSTPWPFFHPSKACK